MNPNDLGKFLVEDCQRVNLAEYLAKAKKGVKQALLASLVSVLDTNIKLTVSQTRFGGTRQWFSCPACACRVGVLFVHPITKAVGCRVCLGLEYRKRRFKGMPESKF